MVKVVKKVSENYVKNAEVARNGNGEVKVMDVTLDGGMGFLDPGSEWGRIEIEGREVMGLSIMGVWEGLKVYRNKSEVDERFIKDVRKLGKVRDCKSYGELIGIRWGDEVLSVKDGERVILKEMYEREVMSRYGKVIRGLKELSKRGKIVLLDYKDEDRRLPVSHAEILKEMIES